MLKRFTAFKISQEEKDSLHLKYQKQEKIHKRKDFIKKIKIQ